VGNVFVTGNSYQSGEGQDYITIKYNSNGVQQWANRFNGVGNGDDTAFGLAIDVNNNVIVTGCAKDNSANLDYVTIKYTNDGTFFWKARYNGPGNGTDEARAVVVDGDQNVYVTGFSMGSGTNYDFATIKYDMNGNSLWTKRYNGMANLSDKAWAIAISKQNAQDETGIHYNYFIYVTGQSMKTTNMNEFVTIKYDLAGDTLWVNRFVTDQVATDDVPVAIAAIDFLNVVASTGTINNDYGTVLYYRDKYFPGPRNNAVNTVQIMQNYPNPFNPTTTIEFSVLKESEVSIMVYDLTGKEVTSLVKGKLEQGEYEVKWNASEYPSGVYFYSMYVNGEKQSTQRMLLVK